MANGLNLKIASSKKEIDISLESGKATVKDLKKAYYKASKLSSNRISFKKGEVRIEDDKKTLVEYGVTNGDTLSFKDLGPQIGYRTVFVVEYAGPIFIMLLYALRPSLIYGTQSKDVGFNRVAQFALAFWLAHFIKRELETFFVHKFSRPTMPLNNLFKNCAYYWAFAAVIGYFVCHPSYVEPESKTQVHIGAAIFVLSEIGNLICHIMLSNLRAEPGSTERKVPTGFLFNLVSCPNYTFEILAWVGFSIMTNLLFSYVFTIVGFVQMADWAIKKHKAYVKSNESYKKLGRKAIVPFVL